MIIQLVDLNSDMVDAWTDEFDRCDDVVIYHDDCFNIKTDCIVSPANSFGFMGGGLDGVITRRLGIDVQTNVQNHIKNSLIGELLVGQAILVETNNTKIPYCISAPTMRISMNVEDTPNVYLASKAIFAILIENIDKIDSVTISGLGTGVGGFAPETCAKQMKMAYDEVWLGNKSYPKSLNEAISNHIKIIK